MHPLHDYIAKQLAEKLKSRKLVVWYDARGEFARFFAEIRGGSRTSSDLVPVSVGGVTTRLAEYAGSMFELRAVVEPRVSGDTPESVVIYLPGCERDRHASVLMELEKAGECYEPQLRRLARNVLRQRYTDGVIDEMLKVIEGGRPIKRKSPAFPALRASKNKDAASDPSSTGVTDKGGAYSIGSGRGALTAAYAPGTVKVEVLVSLTGDVVFAHVVDGRDDLNGAAILAARGWKFSPAKLDGSPVQVSGVITFDLKPPGSRPTASPTPKKP